MIAAGRNIGGIDVAQGSVIFLAGENPDDLRCRLYAACQAYGLKADELPIFVLPNNFPMTPEAVELVKQQIDALICYPVLIVIDTAAAYFPGDDDNLNVPMGAYARSLRALTACQNKPAVPDASAPSEEP